MKKLKLPPDKHSLVGKVDKECLSVASPLLVCPGFGDQQSNAARAETLKSLGEAVWRLGLGGWTLGLGGWTLGLGGWTLGLGGWTP